MLFKLSVILLHVPTRQLFLNVWTGGKTDAELEAEMMDRALKESLDAASTQDADAVDEQRILERALKESLATSKKTKVQDCIQYKATFILRSV